MIMDPIGRVGPSWVSKRGGEKRVIFSRADSVGSRACVREEREGSGGRENG